MNGYLSSKLMAYLLEAQRSNFAEYATHPAHRLSAPTKHNHFPASSQLLKQIVMSFFKSSLLLG